MVDHLSERPYVAHPSIPRGAGHEDRDRAAEELRSLLEAQNAGARRVRALEEQRRRYFQNTKEGVLGGFFGSINSEISWSQREIDLARSLPEFERWARREPTTPTVLGRSLSVLVDRQERWLDEIPPAWEQEGPALRYSRGRTAEEASRDFFERIRTRRERAKEPPEDEPRRQRRSILTFAEAAEMYRARITAPRTRMKVRNGLQTFEVARQSPQLDLLLEEDRRRFEVMIDAFIAANREVLIPPLRPTIRPGFSDDDLLNEVRRAQAALRSFKATATALNQRMKAEF